MSRQQPSRQSNTIPPAKRAFEDGQYVVTIQPEFVACELGGFDAESAAALDVFVRAGIAGDGIALAAGEVVAIADEFNGAARGVAAVEQPAKVGGGGAQGGKLPGGEEPLVLRGKPAMCLMAWHDQNSRVTENARHARASCRLSLRV